MSRRTAVSLAALLTISARVMSAQGCSQDSGRSVDRGVRRQEQGDLVGARQAYEIALKLGPQRIDARSNLGLTYAGLHLDDRAIHTFDSARAI